jgi:hypothetical protein
MYTHICMCINYRGYGKSTGIPTPTGLKNDGCIVAEYLRNIKGVSRLVIHGESVGMFERYLFVVNFMDFCSFWIYIQIHSVFMYNCLYVPNLIVYICISEHFIRMFI